MLFAILTFRFTCSHLYTLYIYTHNKICHMHYFQVNVISLYKVFWSTKAFLKSLRGLSYSGSSYIWIIWEHDTKPLFCENCKKVLILFQTYSIKFKYKITCKLTLKKSVCYHVVFLHYFNIKLHLKQQILLQFKI